MRFLLIPVTHGLPALEAHLARWPHDDGVPPSAQELRELADLAAEFVTVSEMLLRYVLVVAGRPQLN